MPRLLITRHKKRIEKERTIAKNSNTFLKKKREMEKKLKAQAKREKREERKRRASEPSPTPESHLPEEDLPADV